MSEGSSRPGGLTVLAVLNFVFGGLGALGMLGLAVALFMMDRVTDGEMAEALSELPSKGVIIFALAVGVVTIVLLLVSGVGYLKQQRFKGRTLGSLYAVIALASSIITLVAMGQPFKIGNSVDLIYPIVTLALLNTTFKEDFINP